MGGLPNKRQELSRRMIRGMKEFIFTPRRSDALR